MERKIKLTALLLITILLIQLFSPFSTITLSNTSTDGNWEYKELANGTIEITAYKGTSTVLTIPSTIDNKTVTSIGVKAFERNFELTNVTIPNTVTSLGEYAFYQCENLTDVTLKEGLKTIGPRVFWGCRKLINITIPNTVTEIGVLAFTDCSLTSITIPEGVKNIGFRTFSGCGSLSNVEMLGVETIDGDAFENCMSLRNITIPSSVKSINNLAFEGCSNLTSINVSGDNQNYQSVDGVLFNKDKTIIIKYPASKEGESYTIPEGVTNIAGDAFTECYYLKSITIPSTIKSIMLTTFDSCNRLGAINVSEDNQNYQSIDGVLFNKDKTTLIRYPAYKDGESYTIPEGVKIIDQRAFYGCDKLTNVTIPNSVTTIGEYAFSTCKSLTNVTIPNSITTIEGHAFANCPSLIDVTIPGSVSAFGDSVFYNCDNLTNVVIEEGVTNIGEDMFFYCEKLTSVTMPNSLTIIGKSAFSMCQSLTNITIPNSVTTIEESAFGSCKSLTNVTIPNSVTTIEQSAFAGCTSLTNVTIPNSVTTIEQSVFSSCTSLTNVTIPNSVTDIEYNAFKNCTNLTNIFIPRNVTYFGYKPFENCTNLTITCYENSTAHEYAQNNNINYVFVDEIPPTCIITTNINSNLTNADSIIYTFTFSEEVIEFTKEDIVVTNGTKGEFSGSGSTYTLVVKSVNDGEQKVEIPENVCVDLGGNANIAATSNITTIDITKPTCIIAATPSESPVNTDSITYTFIFNEEVTGFTKEDIIVTNGTKGAFSGGAKSYTLVVTNTGSCEQKIEIAENICMDAAGNGNEKVNKVVIIDKTAPTGTVSYNVTTPINGNVTATITANEKLQEVTGWTLSSNKLTLTKTYTENAEETVTITDLAGNSATVNVKVSNIDRTAPSGTVSYSPSSVTNGNVTATITGNKALQAVSGWTLSGDKLTLTKTYTTNAEETVTITDLAGNTGTVIVNVSNIDKTAPSGTVMYSPSGLTNGNVAVTITGTEKLQEINGWTLLSDKLTISKTYTANTEETVTIKDLAGNTATVTVKVSNIDKTAPVLNIDNITSTENSIIISPRVTDENLGQNPKYVFYIKKANEPDTAYVEKNITATTNNTYTITGLEENISYIVKVIIADLAGNETVATKEITTNNSIPTIISPIYNVNNNIIKGIKPETTAEQVRSNIISNKEYDIVKKDGTKIGESDVIGTGYKIKFPTGEEYIIVVKADTNGDGKVSVTDLVKIKKHIVEIEKLQGEYEQAGDVNSNESITVTDLAMLKKIIVGLVQL